VHSAGRATRIAGAYENGEFSDEADSEVSEDDEQEDYTRISRTRETGGGNHNAASLLVCIACIFVLGIVLNPPGARELGNLETIKTRGRYGMGSLETGRDIMQAERRAREAWKELDIIARNSSSDATNKNASPTLLALSNKRVGFVRVQMRQLFREQASVHVCELEFNCGHSAVLYLTAIGSKVTYTGFGSTVWPWSEAAVQFLQRMFTGRFVVLAPQENAEGPADNTPLLLTYASEVQMGSAAACDLLSVEGDSYAATLEHLQHGKGVSRSGGLVFADGMGVDVTVGVQRAWEEVKGAGLVQEIACEPAVLQRAEERGGWCLGRYV
jgi:hypothetical protein